MILDLSATLTAMLFLTAASVMMLRNLDRLARAQGGAVYMLNGNHESLNIAGDFRCVAGLNVSWSAALTSAVFGAGTLNLCSCRHMVCRIMPPKVCAPKAVGSVSTHTLLWYT